MDKLTIASFGDRDQLKADLEKLKRQMPELIEYAAIRAGLMKASFDGLVGAGFTPEQALELCKQGH